MRMRWGVLVLATLLTQEVVGWAASFDCRKAVRPEEKAVCSDAELGKADEEMAAAYRSAVGRVSAAMAEGMREDQRGWLRWIAMVCEAAGSTDAKKLASCMVGPYRERGELLEKAVERQGDVLFATRSVYLAARVKDEDSAQVGASFPGFGTVTASWLQADSNDEGWVAWNAAAARWPREMFNEGGKDVPWSAKLVVGADEDIAMMPVRVTPTVVSVNLGDDSMGHGAAHPNEFSWSVHWLRAERRELKAGDVFQDGMPWKRVVARRRWDGIVQELGKDGLLIEGPTAKELLRVVGSPRNWTLDGTGLTISFPEYSVSPRASPAPDVTVPWAALKPYLAAGSPVGR